MPGSKRLKPCAASSACAARAPLRATSRSRSVSPASAARRCWLLLKWQCTTPLPSSAASTPSSAESGSASSPTTCLASADAMAANSEAREDFARRDGDVLADVLVHPLVHVGDAARGHHHQVVGREVDVAVLALVAGRVVDVDLDG